MALDDCVEKMKVRNNVKWNSIQYRYFYSMQPKSYLITGIDDEESIE